LPYIITPLKSYLNLFIRTVKHPLCLKKLFWIPTQEWEHSTPLVSQI
jgi:hypothetical protein